MYVRTFLSVDDLTASVAAQFKALRQARGWSLQQVADTAGLHPSTVHLIETGKRGISLGTAARLAEAFDVKLSQLVATAEQL